MEMKAAITVPAIVANPLVMTLTKFDQNDKRRFNLKECFLSTKQIIKPQSSGLFYIYLGLLDRKILDCPKLFKHARTFHIRKHLK